MTAIAAARAWRQYLCRVCGLVYDEAEGDADSGLAPGTRFEDIPDDWACPVCGVGKGDFELCVPATTADWAAPRAARSAPGRVATRDDAGVVIVGAGRAGWQVAQALRERCASLPITLVSACSGDVYDKPTLSVAVARGLAVDGLVRERAADVAARLNLRLLCDTHAVAIDAPRRRLRTTRGTLRYRQLVLAHGAEPALPAVLPAALVWRINDLPAYQRLRAALAGRPQRLAIVGAGLVGCELANDLALAGHLVTLLDVQPRPLALQLPEAASQRLLAAWQGLPLHFIGQAQVAGVDRLHDGAAALRVRLADRRSVEVDHVIAATGLRAPSRLARSADLAFDEVAGGVVVDALTGATSQPGIHALGDCVVVDGRASRYIEPILRQAQALAAALLGGVHAAPANAAAAVLRVKTSALPITVTGTLAGAGDWRTESDDATGLQMQRHGPGGERLATLVARAPVH